jgi:alkanesulfonate monooxygenase SsuD/methylene tetrahydromethanopterin reductase-like flavin-dependent oxidoreductase (luciferase family)
LDYADTIEALAEAAGLPPENLAATVVEYNDAVRFNRLVTLLPERSTRSGAPRRIERRHSLRSRFTPRATSGRHRTTSGRSRTSIIRSDAAVRSMQTAFEQFGCADEFGLDWVTVAEHHYSGFSLTPNPVVMAGALSQIVRRAKTTVLRPTLPILNPVRGAEELAMIDTMSGGRVVAGMVRGTPNEYVTYNMNPEESRERVAEALHLIRRAWTETRPFGWLGRYYQYRTISIWPRPVQQPHPFLYMSGSSPEAGEFAARNRIGIGFAFTTVPLAKAAAQHYRVCARDAYWEPRRRTSSTARCSTSPTRTNRLLPI